jgi:hypothetical protein
MLHSAGKRHKHRQALYKRLQHNCSPREECNTNVIPMVRIRAQGKGGIYATRPVIWATESMEFSVRGYEVPSELSEPSRTPGCF